MKKIYLMCFFLMSIFISELCLAKNKKVDLLEDFPPQNQDVIFENILFYDTLYSKDMPELALQLRPNAILFKNALPKNCALLQNLDTRLVYRCYHGNFSYGDYYTYHIFVSVGPDENGNCLVVGDTSLSPDKLNPGRNPVVYYFKSQDCGVYEDLSDYLIRF